MEILFSLRFVFALTFWYDVASTSGMRVRTLYVGTGPQGCDSYRTNHVNEQKVFNIIWREGHTPPLYCKFGFDGQGSDKQDKYKVCAEVTSSDFRDCSVHIKFFFGNSNTANVTYGCMSNMTKVCTDEDQKLDVSIDSSDHYKDILMYPTEMILQITAVKTYDYKENVMSIVAVAATVLGIIFGVTFIVVVVVICLATRKGHNVGRNWRKKTIKKSLHYNPTGTDIPYDQSVDLHRRDLSNGKKRNRPRHRREDDDFASISDIIITESSQHVFPPTLRWRPEAPPSYEEAISRNIPSSAN